VTTTASALTLRPLDDADQDAVLALLTESLAGGPTGERTADFLRWKHVTSPFGPSIALGAEENGRLAGVRLVMRWEFTAGGERVRAARMVDTATHPDYRGRGIFRDLTMAALEIARADTDLIFNTPNGSSRPGYLKMGWHQVGTLRTALAPVRPVRLASGARAALVRAERAAPAAAPIPFPSLSEVLDQEPRDVAELLAARSAEAGRRLATRADPAYLAWRYCNVPGLDYRAIPVMRSGRMCGLGIGRVRARSGLRELTLTEVLVSPGDRAAARAVLRTARRGGTDHVATHLPEGSTAARSCLASGYLTTRRVGLTLTTLPLHAVPGDPRTPGSWALSLGDVEVF
jgi:GNAT superfamily N-acetyltransferase